MTPPKDDLFLSLLEAPDRDHCPGTNPVLSWREDDPPSYLEEIERYGVGHYELVRRGVWHGRWSELEAAKLLPRPPRGRALHAALQRRWHASEPVVLRRVMGAAWRSVRETASERLRAHARLLEAATEGNSATALRAELGERSGAPRFGREPLPHDDPERDLAKLAIEAPGRPDADLWVKLARLSTSPDDGSLRARVSFGAEGADDASHDEERHELVRVAAEAMFPEAAALRAERELVERVDRLCAGATTFTQHIAYWNAPGGGALFHHDAFDEDPAQRQLGVLYVQLAGRTGWLALSIERLADRVDEFLELLADGDMPWLRERLFPEGGSPSDLRDELGAREARVRELALPGCGRLGPVVGCGPEFTSLLADAGHAYVLRPGDAILLPNHGLAATAMHSVFCLSPETAYGLSTAIRRAPRRSTPRS